MPAIPNRRALISLLESMFTSHNDMPVTQITLSRQQYEQTLDQPADPRETEKAFLEAYVDTLSTLGPDAATDLLHRILLLRSSPTDMFQRAVGAVIETDGPGAAVGLLAPTLIAVTQAMASKAGHDPDQELVIDGGENVRCLKILAQGDHGQNDPTDPAQWEADAKTIAAGFVLADCGDLDGMAEAFDAMQAADDPQAALDTHSLLVWQPFEDEDAATLADHMNTLYLSSLKAIRASHGLPQGEPHEQH